MLVRSVIEEGLLEEAKKQYPIARQPRRPIRKGARNRAIGLSSTNSNSNSNNSNNSNNTPPSRPYYKRRGKKAIL
ncbi:hypothetical protein P8C59_007029 [Phyllachora maydis]|uniref:Uncharacterized protein n=1 Tax=Phyllachora maydis TaxID=1825666 RepID=A0AAD9MHK6_9PEZI|nr:hypothetical protein P8C59_007029 [Phyllachora maydis]